MIPFAVNLFDSGAGWISKGAGTNWREGVETPFDIMKGETTKSD